VQARRKKKKKKEYPAVQPFSLAALRREGEEGRGSFEKEVEARLRKGRAKEKGCDRLPWAVAAGFAVFP